MAKKRSGKAAGKRASSPPANRDDRVVHDVKQMNVNVARGLALCLGAFDHLEAACLAIDDTRSFHTLRAEREVIQNTLKRAGFIAPDSQPLTHAKAVQA